MEQGSPLARARWSSLALGAAGAVVIAASAVTAIFALVSPSWAVEAWRDPSLRTRGLLVPAATAAAWAALLLLAWRSRRTGGTWDPRPLAPPERPLDRRGRRVAERYVAVAWFLTAYATVYDVVSRVGVLAWLARPVLAEGAALRLQGREIARGAECAGPLDPNCAPFLYEFFLGDALEGLGMGIAAVPLMVGAVLVQRHLRAPARWTAPLAGAGAAMGLLASLGLLSWILYGNGDVSLGALVVPASIPLALVAVFGGALAALAPAPAPRAPAEALPHE